LGIPENGGILDAISKKRPLEGLSKVWKLANMPTLKKKQ
jgi:hypothetical protein